MDGEKIKVLQIGKVVSSYNVPIYSLINEQLDYTYAYTEKCEVKDPPFKTIKLPCCHIGKLIFIKHLHRLAKEYDAVILSTHLALVNTKLLFYIPHKYKILSWSIGLYINYSRKFDFNRKPDWKDRYTRWFHEKSDACIIYSKEPIGYWQKYGGITTDKWFVAHNTVKVASFDKLPDFQNRKNLLFIGTLYAQKGLDELIEAYQLAKMNSNNLPHLIIIGKGPEEEAIRTLIKEKGLNDLISLVGPVYEEDKLKDYFFSSLLCISPKQAGLSVQRSLGYGTPFVTRPDAITGGERFDVIQGVTGLYYNSTRELSDIIISANKEPHKFEIMSEQSYKYYQENATPENMVKGVVDAVKYALGK